GQGLVVPRTYAQAHNFDDVCRDFSIQGWPISVRHSGGGVVPQGPDIINVSLAYRVDERPLDHAGTAYTRLVTVLADTLLRFGVKASAQAVEGSFCDGRFNLACMVDGQPRKIAGTAQQWRRQKRPDGDGT